MEKYLPVLSHLLKKKYLLVLCIAVVLSVGLICYCMNTSAHVAPSPSTPEAVSGVKADDKNAKAIVQQLNQIIFVLTRVIEYNDIRVLKEADDLLSESYINFEVFNDKELINMVTDIKELIKDMLISAGDRRIMEQEIASRRANALWDSFNISTDGYNPLSCVANIVVSGAQSYMAYKTEIANISLDKDKRSWELEKREIESLSKFQNQLMINIATLVTKHRIPDVWRLSVQDSNALVRQLKGANPETVLRIMQDADTERNYQHLPEYWYHRGIRELQAAGSDLSADKAQEAKMSFAHYQSMDLSFRRSRDAVNVAVGMLALLGYEYQNADEKTRRSLEGEILKQIETIKRYSDEGNLSETWKDHFAIYTALVGINKHAEAFQCMDRLLSRLDNESSTMVQQDLHTRDVKHTIRGYAEPIAICHAAMMTDIKALERSGKFLPDLKQTLLHIMNSEYTAFQTKAEWYGTISQDKQLEIIKKAIKGAKILSLKDGKVTVCIPWSFVMLQDVECMLWAYQDGPGSVRIQAKEDYEKCIPNIENGVITGVVLTFEGGSQLARIIRDGKDIEVDVLHPRMPLGLVFSTKRDDNNSSGGIFPKAVRYRQNVSVIPKDGLFDKWKQLP